MTIWDRVVRSPEEARLSLRSEATEYMLADPEGKLRDKSLTLTLRWDPMPYTGFMYVDALGAAEYTMPSDYVAPPQRRPRRTTPPPAAAPHS